MLLVKKRDSSKPSCSAIRLLQNHHTLSQKAKQKLTSGHLAGLLPEHISTAFSLGYNMLKKHVRENSEGGNQPDRMLLV